MLGRAALLTPFLLLGCAAPQVSRMYVDAVPVAAGTGATLPTAPSATAAAPKEPETAPLELTGFALEPQGQPMPPRPRERFTIKGGYWDSTEEEFDDGGVMLLSFLLPTAGHFWSELEIGYLDASGSEGLIDRDVWSIPVMLNGRFNIPAGQKIELYCGLGLGTFYYDGEVKAPGITVDAEGFLFGGDAFLGAAMHLGEKVILGVEWKYYFTESASDLDGGLDAYALLLTLGFDL